MFIPWKLQAINRVVNTEALKTYLCTVSIYINNISYLDYTYITNRLPNQNRSQFVGIVNDYINIST